MDLNIIDKITLFFKLNFNSFLAIALIIIPIDNVTALAISIIGP